MMEILKSKSTARVIAIALLITMMAWLLPTNLPEASAASYPKAPRTASDGTVTWDCVWFGHYPQSSNGKGGFNNDPIKWRVLSVKGNDAFLVADKNLDAKAYNEEHIGITWEQSTIRSWLNGYGSSTNKEGISYTSDNFKGKAFTAGEQSAIYEQTITTADHPYYGTPGGNNTKDKVFLLSIAEAKTPAYGFPGNNNNTETREAKNTAYTASKDSIDSEGLTDWWRLRSPGYSSYNAARVYPYGSIDSDGYSVSDSDNAIRPALHLNLSSNLWKHAGTVSSDGGSNESGGGGTDDTQTTIAMQNNQINAETGEKCFVFADLNIAKGDTFDPKKDLVWTSSNNQVLKFVKYQCIESTENPGSMTAMAEFQPLGVGNAEVSVQLGSKRETCSVTVSQSKDPVKNGSMYSKEDWKHWLQTTGNMIQYLSLPKSFLHVMYISNNDNSVFGRFEYLFTNAIKVGEGWRELLKEDVSKADAEKILCALLDESGDEVEAQAMANTANNVSQSLSWTLENYLKSEGYDIATTQKLSQYMSTDTFETVLSKKGYDKAMDNLLGLVDSKAAAKLKTTFQDFKVSKELSGSLKGLGVGLDILDLTKMSFDQYFEYLKASTANDYYFDALKYIQDHAEASIVREAAKTVYNRAKMNTEEAKRDIALSMAYAAGTDKVIDKALEQVWFLEAAKKGIEAGNMLSNMFFHTQDLAKLKSSMRVSAYIGQSLSDWTRQNYNAAKSNFSYEKAEATMFGMKLLTQARKLGETSLKNCAPFLKDTRAEQLSCEIIANMDSYSQHIDLIQEYDLQLLRAACPVNVEVYDKNNKLVLTVYDGKETAGKKGDISYYTYYSRIEKDYLKVILAPKGYTFKLKGTGLGKVSSKISQITSNGTTDAAIFDQVDVSKGKELLIEPYNSVKDATYKTLENGKVIDEKSFVIEDLEKSISVTGIKALTADSLTVKKNDTILIDYRVTPENATNKEMNWSSSDPKIATVNQDGVVKGISKGTAQITAVTTDGDFKKSCSVQVIPQNISRITMTQKGSSAYTGKAQKPQVVIKDKTLTLKNKVDYTLQYNNNVNIGTGKIFIKGKGNYVGTVTKTFTINPARQSWQMLKQNQNH